MSEVYINTTYPESRRVYSRPFQCFHHKISDRVGLREFKEVLHDVGMDLIGKPFSYCADMQSDREQALCFFPPMWNINKMADFSNTKEYRNWLNTLPQEVRDSVQAIVKECVAHSNSSSVPFDTKLLKRSFETLWAYDLLLDARLTYIEDLFATQNDTPYCRNMGISSSLVTRSLEWAAKPQNAERIATMFLYSRIAQHFGEDTGQPLEFVMKFKHDLQLGRGQKAIDLFQENPGRYYMDMMNDAQTPQELSGLSKFFKKLAGSDNITSRSIDIKGVESLRATIPTMMADYYRLATGEWAKSHIQNAPQPKPVRAA